ncbi:hypothetical protein AA0119_g682 [Alternaria tenuissima]|uniref:Uncharacterized protein n=2 Tax=Alternaria alternata complex TaxID=187734 RepID=A0A4Q4NAA7_ALTAL|nr:hypothetical protein AA0115_g893 [Alternaria tenuissima]RYN72711.1 hypothetical protein AA0117_g8321 [Alternaria alternata]RYN60254.1 hypothetical protein AA0118_g6342 [Alternaria tenuissima]RYO09302.1 hypothetical protein AA0119_g682 [Alternaria tenuissima]RYO21630.1 hypothetical protein AA0121_g2859 [Alternaria tenuissima]
MAIFSTILLLAAYSTSIIAGPVPKHQRRQLFTSYANTTSAAFSTSTQQIAEAETAIIVEPIQQTILTSIAPAITFVLPDGKPLVTQDPQTVFSTSYITPSALPSTEESSSAVATTSVTQSLEPTPTESVSVPISSAIETGILSSSVGAVDNKTASQTSQQIPLFTYSPIEEETSTSLATPPASATSAVLASTTGGLSGFTHPAAAPSSLPVANTTASSVITSTPSMIESVVQASSSTPLVNSTSLALPLPISSGSPTAAVPSETASDAVDVTSRIVVTQYTTIYATSQPPQTPAQESAMPSEAQESVPVASSSLSSEVAGAPTPSPSNAPAEVSPSASLQVPPVVIVTSYTTVMPTPTPQPSQAPETPVSSAMPEPVLSSSMAPSSSIASSSSEVAEPTPTAPALSSSMSEIPAPTPTPPAMASSITPTTSSAPESSAQTTTSSSSVVSLPEASSQPSLSSSTAPPPEVTASTSDAVPIPPAPTDMPSSASPEPEPVPSSTTSEGPLIITPIPPSQVFTVTVTATATEKETVKETTTVTVTA